MFEEILLALIQGASEFLPISSSGHLALISNLTGEPNFFLITALHLASLIAVIIFTRKEIWSLITFEKRYRKWWGYLIIATIPAALVGFFLNDFVKSAFESYLFLGIGFLITGSVLTYTKLFERSEKRFNPKRSLIVGLAQSLAIFPGVSRSGMTISSGIFQGLDREKAAKFSFLLFIPLSIAAFFMEFNTGIITYAIIIPFFICIFASIFFLNLLTKIIKQDKFWMFGPYCLLLGLLVLILLIFRVI
jgi:undecaprenyl-diphosphatase